jgi:hypothetical protein
MAHTDRMRKSTTVTHLFKCSADILVPRVDRYTCDQRSLTIPYHAAGLLHHLTLHLQQRPNGYLQINFDITSHVSFKAAPLFISGGTCTVTLCGGHQALTRSFIIPPLEATKNSTITRLGLLLVTPECADFTILPEPVPATVTVGMQASKTDLYE